MTNKAMNDYIRNKGNVHRGATGADLNKIIRQTAGRIPQDEKPEEPEQQPQIPKGNAGAGTETPPVGRISMNDWIRRKAGR
jgi:hypothetical protein